MHRAPGLGTDAEGRPVFVGARAQMGDAAQKFVGMAFFLQGKAFRIGQAEDRDAFGPHFPFLALARRGHQFAAYGQGRAGIGFAQSRVGLGALVHNALHVGEAGAVVDLHKGKALGVAAGAHPAAEGDVVPRLFGVEGVNDECALHGIAPCGWISLGKNWRSVAFPRARLKSEEGAPGADFTGICRRAAVLCVLCAFCGYVFLGKPPFPPLGLFLKIV